MTSLKFSLNRFTPNNKYVSTNYKIDFFICLFFFKTFPSQGDIYGLFPLIAVLPLRFHECMHASFDICLWIVTYKLFVHLWFVHWNMTSDHCFKTFYFNGCFTSFPLQIENVLMNGFPIDFQIFQYIETRPLKYLLALWRWLPDQS